MGDGVEGVTMTFLARKREGSAWDVAFRDREATKARMRIVQRVRGLRGSWPWVL